MKQKIYITEEYKSCLKYIKRGEKFTFISGKAGVGKSMLIKYLEKKLQHLNVIKLAPTGISAINVEGQTIHSFFGFPSIILNRSNVKFHPRFTDIAKSIDLLIIDEISMVRADVLDGISISLQKHRSNKLPFGGVQILVLGDLFQLPPVLKEEDENYFLKHYETEFFFSAKVFKDIDFYIQPLFLDKVFRQSNQKTIEVLNKIRENKDHREAVAYINRNCYGLQGQYSKIKRDITLTTNNNKAAYINNYSLNKLPTTKKIFKAKITDIFNIKMPTPEILELKVGARVMFTKNGSSWVNGTLGEVHSFNGSSILVKILSTGEIVTVNKTTWENRKYNSLNNMEGETTIDSVVIGTFEQYPLTLAWAITIHKSQGLTLDSLNIDLDRGAFAAGQTYVALSRCKDLSHVSLARPIKMGDVKVDKRVINFYNKLMEEIEFFS